MHFTVKIGGSEFMKRLLSLTLVLILLLTGCQGDKVKKDSAIKIPDSLQGISFDENLTISIGFWNIQDIVNVVQKDSILAYIEELFNITIEPVSVTWSDYKERYQILSATKSLPDVFANLTISSSDNNDSATLNNLITSQSIRSIPRDLTKFSGIKSLLDSFDYIKYTDENYFVIPRLSFLDPILASSDAAMIVRKDWMKNLGLTEPKSLSEFIDLVSAFAHNDPDGNGIDDTIGYNVNNRIALGKWLILGIAPQCNVYSWIQTDDGYIPSFLTEDFKKVVSAYRTLYERGGLDPDFYTKKSTDAVDDFVSGKLGALEFKSSPSAITELKSQWNLYSDKPFEDCVDVLNIFPAEDGNRYSNSSNMFWSETLISSNVDDVKMERILYLFDYLLSDEGMKLTRYGIEGDDYTYKDGAYNCLLDTSSSSLIKTLENKYPSLLLFSCLATWGGTWNDFEVNEINNLRFGKYAMELSNEAIKWNIDNTIQVERPYDFLLIPKENTELFSTEAAIEDFIRVIIGKEDPIIMWNSIIDDYYKNGLAKYIERQNQIYLKK